MPYNEDEVRSETNSLHGTSLTDELDVGDSSSTGADEVIESPRSESARADEIRIDREERALSSAELRDGLAIRAGLIVIVLIALLGVAWIVSSSLGSSNVPSSPSVQIADSSAAIPGSKGDRIQPMGNGLHERIEEPSVDDKTKDFSPPAKPSLKSDPLGSPAIGHSTGLRQRSSSIPVNGKEAKGETQLTPVPETRPTTIQGWTVREVTNGLAALEGPNGTWRVRRGDTVPGVGRIDSIVLSGQRWIVATSQGLISTP